MWRVFFLKTFCVRAGVGSGLLGHPKEHLDEVSRMVVHLG
jgi:hypothetical protein